MSRIITDRSNTAAGTGDSASRRTSIAMTGAVSAHVARRLVARCAAVEGCLPHELAERLSSLVDADAEEWARRYRGRPEAATWASGVLAAGAVDGCARPRIAVTYRNNSVWSHAQRRLYAVYGELAIGLETILDDAFAIVPRLESYSAAMEIITLRTDNGAAKPLLSVLGSLRPGRLLAVSVDALEAFGEEVSSDAIDAVQAARLVRGTGGDRIAAELLDSHALHPVLEQLARSMASSAGRPSVTPVRHLAGLPAEVAALVLGAAPRRTATWRSTEPVWRHARRLGGVLGLRGAATLAPDPGLLASFYLDETVAAAYDRALLDDVEEEIEQILEESEVSEEEAETKARGRVMTGFVPFLAYLEAARNLGARVAAIPEGIAHSTRSEALYYPVREDLAPDPATWARWLALLPELVAGEPDGRHVILQSVTASRAYVTLGLQRDCWVPCEEGALLFARPDSNKTGRAALFLASCFVERYGIDPSWLPVEAPARPRQLRRDEFADCVRRARTRFTEMTGLEMPGRPVAFTRSAMAQALRPQLSGLAREAITALLGHRLRVTRANYWRSRRDEVTASYDRAAERRIARQQRRETSRARAQAIATSSDPVQSAVGGSAQEQGGNDHG